MTRRTCRWPMIRGIGLLSLFLLMASLNAPVLASIKQVSIGAVSFSPTSQSKPTLLFRNGDNPIEIVVSNAGIEIREYCRPAGPGGRLIAMGSIKSRPT